MQPSADSHSREAMKEINMSSENLNNNITSDGQGVVMVLDEATGVFIPVECTAMNVDEEKNVDSILNHTDSAASDVSPSRPSTITLSEHSGIISKRPRKNQGDTKGWERNKIKKAREEGKGYFSMTRKKK
ncbi:hypothetical protein EVAR_95060_1 [Eumeta japonica]|uniref:Uncharacterized protein n=1 Tax=Eumeta variegata TaxID=151549 RepID=A0A4C1W5J0_EUMVA|nr:hypothetical protein EVAR_95060_1 [Eumeta japonica]